MEGFEEAGVGGLKSRGDKVGDGARRLDVVILGRGEGVTIAD